MNPMNVDRLFDEIPELFAYTLPSQTERAQLRIGDLVKMFFKFDRFNHPKPVWFTVTENSGLETNGATAVLANMNYGEWAQSSFQGTVKFGIEHIYRLPMDRPESENPSFDASCRS